MRLAKLFKDRSKIITAIFIAALLFRIIFLAGVSIAFKDSKALNEDAEYGMTARSLIMGAGYNAPILEMTGKDEPPKETANFRPTANQLPFYPLVLAAVYSISDAPLSFWVVRFLQAIFSSVTCIIIYLIAMKLFDQRAAIIAGILSVVYLSFIFFTARIVPETFLTFWLSLSVLHLLILRDAPSPGNQIICGILLGITLLNSNVIGPVIPFIGIWIILLAGTWKENVKRTLLVMAVALLVVSPWLARNYQAFNEFPLMKTTAGLNFWLGNNPSATGTFFLPSSEKMDSILPATFYSDFKLSETEQDKKLYDEAMTYVKQNPMHFARLFLKKLYYFTWFPPDNLVSKEVRFYNKLFKIPYGFILAGCTLGIILFLKRNARDTFLLGAIIISFAVLYSVFIVGHARYRMPIEPYIILFASYAISSFFGLAQSYGKNRRYATLYRSRG